jgi:hypothetical protein
LPDIPQKPSFLPLLTAFACYLATLSASARFWIVDRKSTKEVHIDPLSGQDRA